ncbi:hypothetical protein CRUP_025915 [Coryphaenoides rupestris]|nr:hypothetical protein CRUP_025915 [Coryphaenoides rupestris]
MGRPRQSVPGDLRKRTWSQVTAAINEIGECKREVLDVVKKWSDLKCDTRRKLLAMRTDTLPERKVAARGARDLTPTERIVHEILQMDNTPWEDGAPLDDEDEEDWISPMEEEEEEEEEDDEDDEDEWTPERPWIRPSSTFAMRKRKFRRLRDDPAAGAAAYVKAPSPDQQQQKQEKQQQQQNQQQQNQQQQPRRQPPPPAPSSVPLPFPLPPLSSSIASSAAPPAASSSSFSAVLPEPPGPAPEEVRGSLLQNAALSLQEQHAGNVLLETVSRSLELLAESLQQLAESQAVFARQSLQLQRETVDTLRNFATGAVALMHDRLNGKPPPL